MSNISKLLKSQIPENLGVHLTPELKLKDLQESELPKAYYCSADIPSIARMLKNAWFERHSGGDRTLHKTVLLSAPLFYPVGVGKTFIPLIEDPTKKPIDVVGMIFPSSPPPAFSEGSSVQSGVVTHPPPPPPATSSPPQQEDTNTKKDKKQKPPNEIKEQSQLPTSLSRLLDFAREIARARFTTISDVDILHIFATFGCLTWRALVKTTTQSNSPWMTNETGIYRRTINTIRSFVIDEEDRLELIKIEGWYLDMSASDLASSDLVRVMISLLAHESVVPPYIAAAIQSVWMYHGMGTYLFLHEAAKQLGTKPVKLLMDMCLPAVNSTIESLVDLMEDQGNQKHIKVFPYLKILYPTFYSGAASKSSLAFMYLIRQILEPRTPGKEGQDGIWGKVVGKPGKDIQVVMYNAALKIRRKYMLSADEDQTSKLMQQVIRETSLPTSAPPSVPEDEDNLAEPCDFNESDKEQ
nr:MAG: hypothetical protein [Dicrocoelium Rhabdo-like virus 1]